MWLEQYKIQSNLQWVPCQTLTLAISIMLITSWQIFSMSLIFHCRRYRLVAWTWLDDTGWCICQYRQNVVNGSCTFYASVSLDWQQAWCSLLSIRSFVRYQTNMNGWMDGWMETCEQDILKNEWTELEYHRTFSHNMETVLTSPAKL